MARAKETKMSELSEDEVNIEYNIQAVKDTLLLPYTIATSKPFIRLSLSTIFLFITSLFLAVAALVAYTTFYLQYIPQLGLTLPIHLQFDTISTTGENRPVVISSDNNYAVHPYGVAILGSKDLVSDQEYEVRVKLSLPRTEANTLAGNFMIDLALYGPIDPSSSTTSTRKTPPEHGPLLHRSRRPAILPHRSPLTKTVSSLLHLPLYLTSLSTDAETLDLSLFESLSLPRGWRNHPTSLRVTVSNAAGQRMQLYECSVTFHARLQGLRWAMHTWPLVSGLVGVGGFWAVAEGAMLFVWAVGMYVAAMRRRGRAVAVVDPAEGIKREDTEGEESAALSDTSRGFPSSWKGQPAVRYSSPPVKSEEDEKEDRLPEERVEGEADVEDEDEEDGEALLVDSVGARDSGLGTSMESAGGGKEPVRRRKIAK